MSPCAGDLQAPIDHEHKHISVVAENADSFSSTPGCIQHVRDEGDISLVMRDNTVCCADHLDVISYAVHAQELAQPPHVCLVLHHFVMAR